MANLSQKEPPVCSTVAAIFVLICLIFGSLIARNMGCHPIEPKVSQSADQ